MKRQPAAPERPAVPEAPRTPEGAYLNAILWELGAIRALLEGKQPSGPATEQPASVQKPKKGNAK